jgi:phage virion morphogenesis protein
MSDNFSIELEGSDTLLAQISGLLAQLEDPKDLMEAIGGQLEANIQLRFVTKTDPAGNTWAPITPNTIKRYKKVYPDGTPGSLLNRNQRMLGTLANNATNDSVEVGFSSPYAIFHVAGTKKMVRRDSLFASLSADYTTGTLGAQDEADILEIVEGFMAKPLA